ncbi:MAG: hypothetical protein Ct9H90mP27_7590 [Gammaproteobacteria bacterium]|nr:MAG: hypothetical protein Ct9H90mP27_7590 [Gammaproteobacteria bacterium]
MQLPPLFLFYKMQSGSKALISSKSVESALLKHLQKTQVNKLFRARELLRQGFLMYLQPYRATEAYLLRPSAR